MSILLILAALFQVKDDGVEIIRKALNDMQRTYFEDLLLKIYSYITVFYAHFLCVYIFLNK